MRGLVANVRRNLDDREVMEDSSTQNSPRPVARLEFARRLRELRAARGFRTARSLARTLDIDENRYTRYERAEVEPDLELLMRICSVLNATPNDLLGADKLLPPAGSDAAHGHLAETGAAITVAADTDRQLQSIGWELCALVAELRQPHEPRATAAHAAPPLAYLQTVTGLQQQLERQPFNFIGQIVRERAVLEASPDKLRELGELVARLTAAVKRSADAKRLG